MTPPAKVKAGGFSSNGMSNLYRWRLKAPSEPIRQAQDVQRGIQVAPQEQSAGGARMHSLGQCLWDVLAAARTALRGTGWIHLDQCPTGACCLVGQDRDELAPTSVMNGLGQHRTGQCLDIQVFDGNQSVV